MSHLSTLLLSFCLVSTSIFAKEDVSGIRIRMTRTGLDYASALGTTILDEKLAKTPIPNINASIRQGPGSGHVKIQNINITNFKAPDFTYVLHPNDSSLTFGSKGGLISVVGDWEAWYKVILNISLSGAIKASASEIDIRLTTKVGKTPNALPWVNITKCEAEIGDLSLEIDGGVIQWVINLFRHIIASNLKIALGKKFCEASQGMLLQLANRELQSLPTIIPIYEQFYLHYGLSKEPRVAINYVESSMRAEITWKGEAATPIHPIALPDVTTPANASRMLYLWASDYVLNTFLYTAHEHGAVQFLLNKDADPKVAQFLKTTCSLLCIGRVLPEISKKYPNESVDIHVYSSSAPQAEIRPLGANLNATAFADVYVSPLNESGNLIFSAEIVFYANLEIKMAGRKVVGNLSIELFNLELIKSNIGEIPIKALKVIEEIAKPALQELANLHLTKGLAIPTVEGVMLIRPKLKLLERAVEIETDLSYRKYFPRRILKNWTPYFRY